MALSGVVCSVCVLAALFFVCDFRDCGFMIACFWWLAGGLFPGWI